MSTRAATCCNTDVICSTEHRFFFTAHTPGPLGADCAAETHSAGGLKEPEPLSSAPAQLGILDFSCTGEKNCRRAPVLPFQTLSRSSTNSKRTWPNMLNQHPLKRLTAIVFALWALAASPILAQSKLDFRLMNDTGLTIAEIYVSPNDSDEWGEDIMGKDVLKHRESVDIEFSRKEKSCNWDLKIVDEDNNDIEWTELDLCKASHITLQYRGKKATAIIK
jgi:hypothetical protein